MAAATDTHAFQPPSPDASRCPCPALNALAAHGYLPRDGRSISFMQMFNAMREVYNTSIPLTLLLTLAGFLLCGHRGRPTVPFLGTVDLHDFARHGRIEHDASLAHADAARGAVFAPAAPDPALLADLLGPAPAERLALADLARVRARRDLALALRAKPLDALHAEVTRGEVALTLAVLGDGDTVAARDVAAWMGEDRLPDAWHRPAHTQGLLETVRLARRVGAAVAQEAAAIKAGAPADAKKD